MDLDGRNTVGNHTRRFIFIYELKITFRTAKYTKKRRQMIEYIFNSNQSSTTTLLEASKDHIYIYHFWSDLDGRNTVGNHKIRFIYIYELKITFRAAKCIKQKRQILESIVTSNQSSTTTFMEISEEYICITSGQIWTV